MYLSSFEFSDSIISIEFSILEWWVQYILMLSILMMIARLIPNDPSINDSYGASLQRRKTHIR